MKKLAVYVCCAVIVAACSKKEETPVPSLIGTWKEKSQSIENCADGSLNQPATNCTNCVTIVLSTSNNANFYTATPTTGTPTSGTWLPGGPYTNPTGYISFTESGSSTPSAGTYVMTATTLTIVLEVGFPGPGCKVSQNFTRQ